MSTLPAVFTTVLNMSITASYVAIGVILIRLLLEKVPRIFSYALWFAVLIRLVCPVSFTSVFSILNFLKPVMPQNPGTLVYVPYHIGLQQNPSIDVGIDGINKAVNNVLPQAVPAASLNPMQIVMLLLSIVWVSGVALLVLYSLISYLRVLNKVKTATVENDNVLETDRIDTPFVCGFIKPKIYVPTGISPSELSYILAHERVHIKRLDYLVKPLAFLVLLLHWFNPLMWLCFRLMTKDMEMSCDESVVKLMGEEIKANYANSLLALATNRKGLIPGSPLAFGESNVKLRIKNVLGYQKPAAWVVTAALVATVALVVLFTANPKNEPPAQPIVRSGYPIETLLAQKTPYVGNNVKVGSLINAMPLPAGVVRDKIALQTSAPPYGITIDYTQRDGIPEPVDSDTFYRNSVLLFSLIDNVDRINWQLAGRTGNAMGYPGYDFTYSREAAEQLIGGDVRPYAAGAGTLITLINRLNSISFDHNAVAPVPLDNQIEKYLEIIMSSPQTSSNPQEYINAHETAYNAILTMDAQALPYLFSQFEKGGQTGLKGVIMERLCRSILGGEDIKYLSKNPQDWYDTYKKTIQRLVALNSMEFVQQHNPKGSLISSLQTVTEQAVK